MKLSVVFLVLLGIVAAICAAMLVAFSMARGGPAVALPGQAAPAQEAKVTVLIASRALRAMTVIDEDCVSSITVPKSKAPVDSFASSVQINGKPLSLPMAAGQAFTPSCFAAEGSRAKFASTLSRGQRAFAIEITDQGALDGILYPGSVVDVLTSAKLQSGDAISTTLLSAVEVLAIEKITIVSPDLTRRLESDLPPAPTPILNPVGITASSPPVGNVSGHRVTLRVDERQAKALQVAMENGTLALALRNPLDSSSTTGDPVSLSSALGLDRGPQAWMKVLALLTEKMSAARVAAAAPSPTTGPATAPAGPPQWETTLIRGGASETLHFDMPTGESVLLGKGP